MHTGITSLLSSLEVKVSFSATYRGSSHTLSLASSDQNFLYREYLLATLERLGPALPLSHDGGFSMIHGVRRQCGHALSPPSTGGSSPSPYPFSPIKRKYDNSCRYITVPLRCTCTCLYF